MRNHGHDLLYQSISTSSNYVTLSFSFHFSNALNDSSNAVGISSDYYIDQDIFQLVVYNSPSGGGFPMLYLYDTVVNFPRLT